MKNENDTNITRGTGLLETFLGKKRAERADSLIDNPSREGSILDIGCGLHPYFLINTKFKNKFGLDQTTAEKTTIEDVTVLPHNIEENIKIPFPDNNFNTVTMLAVFEHIEPTLLPSLTGEILRILKPGGSFIMTTPAPWTDFLLRTMARLNLVSREEIEEHKDAYSLKKTSAILESGGFKSENINAGYFLMFMNTWAIAKKPL